MKQVCSSSCGCCVCWVGERLLTDPLVPVCSLCLLSLVPPAPAASLGLVLLCHAGQGQKCSHCCCAQLLTLCFPLESLSGSQAHQQHLNVSHCGDKGLEKSMEVGKCGPQGTESAALLRLVRRCSLLLCSFDLCYLLPGFSIASKSSCLGSPAVEPPQKT